MSCEFLKLFYSNFELFQSKLVFHSIIFCFQNNQHISIIPLIGIFNIGCLKPYLTTITTVVSTKFNMDFIIEKWIVVKHIAFTKKGKLLE